MQYDAGPMPLLSPEVIQEFQENGFVVTHDILSTDELATYGDAVDRVVAQRTALDSRPLSAKSEYEQSFLQCMRLWETDLEVRRLTFHLELAQAASELLGVPAVRLWQDQALYKEPGGRVTDPHQDTPFWPIGDTPLISAWIPFDDSTLVNGAMSYVPGSHLLGRLKVVNLMRSTEPYDILRDPSLEGRKPVAVESAAGSVQWHHGLTVHQAAPNRSDRTRRVFTVVYIASGCRRTHDWTCFPLDRDNIAVGDLIEGAGMPVAWPRESGTLPEPPTARGCETGPQVTVER
jgi:ectoine hydroxylase-related dioxygenase (phytanoyl-CoA dioxygenase family)